MKNPYKNMVKHFNKQSTDVLLANHDQRIYICDNYIVVRVTIQDYALYFHNVKPETFPVMKPGEAITNGEPMENPDALPELYKRHEIDYTNRAIMTSFLHEVESNITMKKYLVRLFITNYNGEPQAAQVQEKFITALDIMDNYTSPGKSFAPLYFSNDQYGCDAIVCPVRIENPEKVGSALSAII